MIHTHHFLKQFGKISLAVFLLFSYGCSSNSTSEEKHQTTADTEQATQTTITVSVPKLHQSLHQNRLQSQHQHQFQLVTV